MQAKKLIEVAMPAKEISAESVIDVRIQHGHISSLHTWWARRPLPVCRAVILASLLPDPLDMKCPENFKIAVDILLGSKGKLVDYYKPYDDIPFTSAIDKMEDNLRNRMMMFIGKFSDRFVSNEKNGKKTEARETLSNSSLIKWENKNNEEILNIARKLIWVSHNSLSNQSALDLIAEHDKFLNDIKVAENKLYSIVNRSIESDEVKNAYQDLCIKIDLYQERMPKVFDPFAGGSAIPLEAARLGCKSFGNDINPVAHIIQKGSLYFPQKYGKPIVYSKKIYEELYGIEELNMITGQNQIFDTSDSNIKIENRLSHDVKYFAKKLLNEVEDEVGKYYLKNKNNSRPIAYYWARVAECINPSCKAEVPLLRQFYLTTKKDKPTFLKAEINGNRIEFTIEYGLTDNEGWLSRGNLKCPCCQNVTDVKKIKEQSVNYGLKERLLAVVDVDKTGKVYRTPTQEEIDILDIIPKSEMPTEKMQRNSAGGDTFSWGINKWGQMFTPRQLLTMNSLVRNIKKIKDLIKFNDEDYKKAIVTYLAILIDRGSTRLTSFGVWNPQFEKIQPIFSRQAIPMVFDYPESVFSPDDGPIASQLDWIIKVIESESSTPFVSHVYNASSGEKKQFEKKYLTAVITDPPYYDAIAYADLSDFFYVWLKKSLGSTYPELFSTPQTPKSEECTALKHHHQDDKEKAKNHFENKLLQIFEAIEYQTSDIVSIMFAHQSTEAWTTLCNSILGANMNITGSWALDTEMTGALKTDKAFLSSSVTVSAKPSQKSGLGDYKIVKKQIENALINEVAELYKLGFRGADLLTACFGQAVSEFGKYEKVEKADGSLVTVAELLEMTRESAFNALLKGFDGDEFTKFYIGWLQLYGFTTNDHNTALRLVQIGLSLDVNDLYKQHILILNQNMSTLASYLERSSLNKNLGEKSESNLIDIVHKAMYLFSGTSRNKLLEYISKNASSQENNFWRVLNSLCEILPSGSDDYVQAMGLLTNKDSLIKESQKIDNSINSQGQLEF